MFNTFVTLWVSHISHIKVCGIYEQIQTIVMGCKAVFPTEHEDISVPTWRSQSDIPLSTWVIQVIAILQCTLPEPLPRLLFFVLYTSIHMGQSGDTGLSQLLRSNPYCASLLCFVVCHIKPVFTRQSIAEAYIAVQWKLIIFILPLWIIR